MRETVAELEALQVLLDRSFESSGQHLRNAFQQSKRPTAVALVDTLPGVFEVHLAVVSSSGAPMVAPVDAMLLHGQVWFGLPGKSVRARLVARDRRVSASYVGDGIALIAHGTAVVPDPGPLAEFEAATSELYISMYGPKWLEWQAAQQKEASPPGFTGYIEPRVIFATAP